MVPVIHLSIAVVPEATHGHVGLHLKEEGSSWSAVSWPEELCFLDRRARRCGSCVMDEGSERASLNGSGDDL